MVELVRQYCRTHNMPNVEENKQYEYRKVIAYAEREGQRPKHYTCSEEELQELIEEYKKYGTITIDLMFDKTKTFYPIMLMVMEEELFLVNRGW